MLVVRGYPTAARSMEMAKKVKGIGVRSGMLAGRRGGFIPEPGRNLSLRRGGNGQYG